MLCLGTVRLRCGGVLISRWRISLVPTASSQSCQTLRVKYKWALFPLASDGLCVIRKTLSVCVYVCVCDSISLFSESHMRTQVVAILNLKPYRCVEGWAVI